MCQNLSLPVEFHGWNKEELYQALTLDKKGEQSSETRLVPEIGAVEFTSPLEEMKF